MTDSEFTKYKKLLKQFYEEACVAMKISMDHVEWVYESNGNRFESILNGTELEVYEIVDATMITFKHYINENWLKDRVENNDLYDLRYLMYHDARTQYQHLQMYRYETNQICEEPVDIVKLWIDNQKSYKRNDGKDSNIDYHLQPLEIDANAKASASISKGCR